MDDRRVFHARGKVLGGSSSINGMIFQRGNPLDYERWAADPGMEHLGLRALPALLQADGELPRRRRRLARRQRPARARARARRRTRCSARSSRRRRRPATRSPTTSTATARRASRVRPQRAPRPPAVRGAGLPPPGEGPEEPHRRDPDPRHQVLFEGNRAVGVDYVRGSAARTRSTPARSILCGGAINSPQLLQLSGVGRRRRAEAARHRRRRTTCPASARTSRTTSRSTSSTPPSSRSRSRPAWRGATGPKIGCRVAVPAQGARRDQPLRGRRLRPQQRRRRLPEPDVPLPPDRDPVRRHRARSRATATRCTSARCTPTPAAA